jgi:Holliday junction resolvase RusA-like endonuclease
LTVLERRYVIVVYGTPAPQGSKRFVRTIPHTGKGIMIESSAKVGPWRDAVRMTALAARKARAPIDVPIHVRMVFTLRKPKSLSVRRRRAFPAVYPDLSKLARSTEDGLTDAGIWADDARVVEYQRLAKVFPNEDVEALEAPGVRIEIWTTKEEES